MFTAQIKVHCNSATVFHKEILIKHCFVALLLQTYCTSKCINILLLSELWAFFSSTSASDDLITPPGSPGCKRCPSSWSSCSSWSSWLFAISSSSPRLLKIFPYSTGRSNMNNFPYWWNINSRSHRNCSKNYPNCRCLRRKFCQYLFLHSNCLWSMELGK